MLPARPSQAFRVVDTFDLIAPDGQVHRFPEPTWLQRAWKRLHAYAEPAVLSVVILGLIYSARLLGQPLDALAADACADQVSRSPLLFWARQFAT